MNKFKLQDVFLKPQIIILFLMMAITLITIFKCESVAAAKFILLIIWAIFIYFYFIKQKIDYIIYPLLYQTFFVNYFMYYQMGWSLWLIMITLFISLIINTYIYVNPPFGSSVYGLEIQSIKNYSRYFYFCLINLIVIEIFLTLIPLPIDPRGKSMILIVIFYILQALITACIASKFKLQNVITNLVIGVLIISGIIVTSSWYTY